MFPRTQSNRRITVVLYNEQRSRVCEVVSSVTKRGRRTPMFFSSDVLSEISNFTSTKAYEGTRKENRNATVNRQRIETFKGYMCKPKLKATKVLTLGMKLPV